MLLAAAPLSSIERYRAFLFGADWYPEQWPEGYWERDAKLMQEAGVNAVRLGEFSWPVLEPREGQYDFAPLERAIALLARHGIKTILATPTSLPPKWLTEHYPSSVAVLSNGYAVDDQTRGAICINHPVYRRLAHRVVESLVEHLHGNPNIIGWQIDNALYSYLDECYSDSCRTAFRGWVQGRYNDIYDLNEHWDTAFWSGRYETWGQIDLPFAAPAPHNPALVLSYRRFLSDSASSFVHDQAEIIHHARPADFVTHNGIYGNIDYHRFSHDLDIFGLDNYPAFSEHPQYASAARLALSRGFDGRFLVMQQQTGTAGRDELSRTPRPGEMSLWAMQAVAHGAEGVLHFRWRTARGGAEQYWSGVLENDNGLRPRYQEFKREGWQLRRVGREVLGSRVVSDIAVIQDFESQWMYRYQPPSREINPTQELEDLFQAAAEQHLNMDAIGRRADLRRYKVVLAPDLCLMDNDLAQSIRQFVQHGGIFILPAQSATRNREGGHSDRLKPLLLNDLFGVEVEGFHCYRAPSRRKNALKFTDAVSIPVQTFADLLKRGPNATAVATWEKDYMRGTPASVENRVGSGKAVYYGSFFNLEAARFLLRRYAAEAGVQPVLPGIPPGVEVTRRSKGATQYYFLLNHSAADVHFHVGAGFWNVLAGAEETPAISLPPYGYAVLRK